MQLERGTTTAEAERKARKLAAELLKFVSEETSIVTLAGLLAIYEREVTPTKKARQTQDRTRPGFGPVKDNTIRDDLKFMIAVLNWGTGTGKDGVPYVARNPWAGSIRRSQRWKMPKELNPRRVGMTDEVRELLSREVNNWQFGAALRLQRETRRRNSSVRQLVWEDIDLEQQLVSWRGETDKCGKANVVPLTPAAVAILRSIPRGIGRAPVFPSRENPAVPTGKHMFQNWLRRAKRRVLRRIEDPEMRARMKEALRGVGFHSEKRAGVRDPVFRRMSPKAQEELAGTSSETLRDVYDQMTVAEMREEMQELLRTTA